jgi:hypothetical protein
VLPSENEEFLSYTPVEVNYLQQKEIQPSSYSRQDSSVNETAWNSSQDDIDAVSCGGNDILRYRKPELHSPTDYHSSELQHNVARVKQIYEQGDFDHEVTVKHGERLRNNSSL